MSELRIALVAEGRTDYEIVSAALKAILPRPFVLTVLQPEQTRPDLGEGWGGVLKWCLSTARRHSGALHDDPTLAHFDLLVLHLDADVARGAYAACGPQVEALAEEMAWGTLPCSRPCPPAADTCAAIERLLESWLTPVVVGARTVLCVPAQSSGTWLAAAALPLGHALLEDLECNPDVERRLSGLPLALRVRKKAREYGEHAPKITKDWTKVKVLCSQALVFEQRVQAALP
jgi:hypothetical protein